MSKLDSGLGVIAQQLHKWRKESKKFGKGSLKLTPEQEKFHELEKRGKGCLVRT